MSREVAKMLQHNLEYYLNNYDTLTPTDLQIGDEIASSDWWTPLKSQFDDLIWMYYGDRTIFINRRFTPEDKNLTYQNLIRTFVIWIKSHKRQLDRLWVSYMSDFNPLWNVDGVEGFVSKDTHTGSYTDTHEGDDKLTYEDNGNTTRSGNETNASTGTDTNTHKVATFDDVANFKNSDQDSIAHGKTDTHTYNNVKDQRDYDGFKNTNYDSSLTRENDLEDDHVDMRIRQGNIGVTRSDQLLDAANDYYMNEKNDFFKYIVRSCVNQVTYAVEGV